MRHSLAAALTGRAGNDVTLRLRGGDLHIQWAENGHVLMTGPATEVFEGDYVRG